MSLSLGSNGLMVRAWTATMLLRFRSYALGRDGQPLRNDGYFGFDEEKVQREYERRTGQFQDGKVSRGDLHRLGLLPTLISVHGTGQPDPFGIGYPADIARRCSDLYWWQPTGNYPAQAVPMNHSADAGEREVARFLNNRAITPGPVAMVSHSQGDICTGRVRNRMRSGDLQHRYKDFIGAVTIGNPMRPKGSYAGNVNPGGEGIDPQRETATEPGVIHLAAKGDLYTTCPDNGVGEMERAVFNAVFSRFTGKDSLFEQLWELFTDPVPELAHAAVACWNGGLFLARGAGPHTRYHLDECPGTGMTFYEYAVKHLRDLAVSRLERITASTLAA